MMRSILLAGAVALYTLFFGTLAIVCMIVIPNGDPLLWMARPWARMIVATCGVRVDVAGRERLLGGRPCVYMSNHQSHFDVLALILALPGQYRILAKRELFYIPIFGWAIWLAGFIPVDRARRDRGIRSIARAAEKVRAGRSILIFAEGTRSADGGLQPLKKGGFHLALQGGAPIVPIAIRGSRAVLPKGGRTVSPGRISIRILDPIETGAHTAERLDLLMGTVREALLAGLAEDPAAAAT
jgi:1-acyl-sn-glycerol-3-phosphate acyltransferase